MSVVHYNADPGEDLDPNISILGTFFDIFVL